MGQERTSGQAGQFWIGISHEETSGCHLGSPKGLTRAGGSPSKAARHRAGKLVLTVAGEATSSPGGPCTGSSWYGSWFLPEQERQGSESQWKLTFLPSEVT